MTNKDTLNGYFLAVILHRCESVIYLTYILPFF